MKYSTHFLLFTESFKSFALTLKKAFIKPHTKGEPMRKGDFSSCFRGDLVLRRYPSGIERCIGCKLCEAICPSQAITVEVAPDKNGARGTVSFDIDMGKCIYCGLCQEACPVDAIVQGPHCETVLTHHQELYYSKKTLLDHGDAIEEQVCTNFLKGVRKL